MQVFDWSEIPLETLTPLTQRQVIHSETMTVARFRLKKGSVVPEHSHANEQISTVEQGRVRFVVNGDEQILTAGKTLQIPPNAPHYVEALEDSVALDIFAPRREDWIRGDDAYLHKG